MRGPTGVKFCTMVSTRPSLIMPVQNFFFGGGTPQKNFTFGFAPNFWLEAIACGADFKF